MLAVLTIFSLQLPVSVFESVIDIINGEVINSLPCSWSSLWQGRPVFHSCMSSRPPCCLQS